MHRTADSSYLTSIVMLSCDYTYLVVVTILTLVVAVLGNILFHWAMRFRTGDTRSQVSSVADALCTHRAEHYRSLIRFRPAADDLDGGTHVAE